MSVATLNQKTLDLSPIAVELYLDDLRTIKVKPIVERMASEIIKNSFIGHLYTLWKSPLN